MNWHINMECECSNRDSNYEIKGRVLGSNVTPIKQYLLWRLLYTIISVKENLRNRGIHNDMLCPMCKSSLKSIDPFFKSCWWTKYVWFGSRLNINFNRNLSLNLKDSCRNNIMKINKETLSMFINILDGIWTSRNNVIF